MPRGVEHDLARVRVAHWTIRIRHVLRFDPREIRREIERTESPRPRGELEPAEAQLFDVHVLIHGQLVDRITRRGDRDSIVHIVLEHEPFGEEYALPPSRAEVHVHARLRIEARVPRLVARPLRRRSFEKALHEVRRAETAPDRRNEIESGPVSYTHLRAHETPEHL